MILAYLSLFSGTTAASGSADDEQIGFTVPAAPWTLMLPADNFKVQQRRFKPDGRSAYFMLTDEKSHLNISLFIEPVDRCKDSKACRDMVWKMGNPSWGEPQNVVLSEIGGVYYFEFLIPSFSGMPIQQQNMYAQFVVDDFWVDLHISKVLYKPQEHDMFERIIKSIKFEPKKKKA